MSYEDHVMRLSMAEMQPDRFHELERSHTVFVVIDAVRTNVAMQRCADDGCSQLCCSAELEYVYAECSAMTSATVHTPRYYGGQVHTPANSRHASPACSTHESLPSVDAGKTISTVSSATHGTPHTVATPRSAHSRPVTTTTTTATPESTASRKISMGSTTELHYSTCGGVEILDSADMRARRLLALRAREIQSQQRRAPSSTAIPPMLAATATTPMTAVRDLGGVATEDGAAVCDELGFSGLLESPGSPPMRRPVLTLHDAWEVLQWRRHERAARHGGASQASANAPQHSCSCASHAELAVRDALRRESGALCVKAPLVAHGALIERLQLHRLFFADVEEDGGARSGAGSPMSCVPPSPDGFVLVQESLLLRPYSYLVWLELSEPTAGTRSHVNVMGCHAWHILLRGTKRWVVADALDKHLLTDPDTGAVADLSHIDGSAFPHAQHAKLSHFTQHAGEAVFIPADSLHLELAADRDFMRQQQHKKTDADHADGGDLCVSLIVQFMDESSTMNFEKHTCLNALLPQSHRNVDLLMPKVVPYTTVDLILFDNNVYPSFRGKVRRYRPEVRQRVLVLRAMTRFAQVALPYSELGARIELEALQCCFGPLGHALLTHCSPAAYVTGVPKGYLASLTEHHLALYYFVEPPSLASVRECLTLLPPTAPLQSFDRDDVSLPAVKLFRSTSSHQGRIPNYVPLSVLLNQRWGFERELCQRLVSVPSIILAKAYNPQGFIRPGSVWHYSRFQFDEDGPSVLMNSETDEVACGPVAPHEWTTEHSADGDVSGTTSAAGGKTAVVAEKSVAAPPPQPLSTSLSFASSELMQRCGKGSCGWCRTFLFFCCPLLERPVAIHPICQDATLQDGRTVGRHGVAPPFRPQIVELEWNVDSLEEYGLVKLIQLEEDDSDEVRRKIILHPDFAEFERFVDTHCMHAGGHTGVVRVEKVMSAVLWFMCTPCIVGYVCGVEPTGDGDEDTARVPTQQQTICLTAGAASMLLSCVPQSFYADLVTRLCNWLCDIAADCTPGREAELFNLVARTLREGNVEAEAIIFQVLDIKRRNVQKDRKVGNEGTTRGRESDLGVDHEAFGFANEDKLARMEQFCADVQHSR